MPSGCNAQIVLLGRSHRRRRHQRLGAAYRTSAPNYLPGATTTGEGSTALGFYNVQQGDAPYFKSLADTYAMSDNFHQSVNGGTGANHIMLGHGDAIWFSDGDGNAQVPPHNVDVDPAPQTQAWWTKSKIPIPRPAPTTGTPKMATAAARTALPRTAAALTPTARTPRSPELPPS